MNLPMAPDTVGGASIAGPTDLGWAVVEIRRDGSLGRAELVTAAGPEEAARFSRAVPTPRRPELGSPALDARLGLLQAATGNLAEAGRSFTRGLMRAPVATVRQDCLGHLALVEAHQGALRQAEGHARRALPGDDDTPGVRHARLALALIHLERAQAHEAALLLDLVPPPLDEQREPWFATARLLLEARLLVATHRPDSAVRLLAEATASSSQSGIAWTSAVLTVERADALLMLGEPHRALAVLTPVPVEAVVDASVATAAACLAIRDVRAADAVLAGVVGALDRAPLAVQLRAWFLEAHIAEERGRHDRCRALLDRGLRAAAAEGMRTLVRREWAWMRPLVERDRDLARTHREFLLDVRDAGASSQASGPPAGSQDPSAALLGVGLTEREREVLELLAQMYSTDEIAAALFVSANTVKTHLKGVFGKLCVNRRVEAVRRGRQLGLC